MNPIEKIFQQLWPRDLLTKNKSKNISENEWLVLCKSLEAFASALFEPKFQPQIVASTRYVGLQNQNLFLPQYIHHQENRLFYLNLILQTSASFNLKLYNQNKHISAIEQRLEHLSHIHKINCYLDAQFPEYHTLQHNIFNQITSQQKKNTNTPLWLVWKELYLLREKKESVETELKYNLKKNEKLPLFLLLSTPCLVSIDEAFILPSQSLQDQNKRNENKAPTTVKNKPHSGMIEHVDIEKEKANPVTHSFEKLETADEYQGGYRIDNGDDELEQHSNALDELDLNKVTRGGEAAQSIYQSDNMFLNFLNNDEIKHEHTKSFLYPEWHAKSTKYLNNYCRLFEDPLQLETQVNDHKKNLISKHTANIEIWKRKIQSLNNQFLWKRRQKDGEEIDYDSYVRDIPALLKRKNVEARWYESKSKSLQECTIYILFDQSMSSDSWVANQRVLDVILEAIGLCGILFENIFDNVSIAGTWSETRKNCFLQNYKNPKQNWEHFFQIQHLIEPTGYTRLGPAIRHVTENLAKATTHKKLLLLITDGKPTDLDGYEGNHGIQDIRQACLEATSRGILPYALTVDNQAKQYFPRMFQHYQMLHDPQKLAEAIYTVLLQLIKGDQ